jgi:hypothetical protein
MATDRSAYITSAHRDYNAEVVYCRMSFPTLNMNEESEETHKRAVVTSYKTLNLIGTHTNHLL